MATIPMPVGDVQEKNDENEKTKITTLLSFFSLSLVLFLSLPPPAHLVSSQY